jgi:methylamine---glutamate N-methyltransferase subunit A
MCGIVGLFAKSPAIEDRLGEHLAAMLRQMNDRGPDSAGVAVYRDPVAGGHSKLVLCTPRASEDWGAVGDLVGATAGPAVRHNHALFTLPCSPADAQARAEEHRPDLRVMSAGEVIEIYKETGRPDRFAELFALGDVRGSHAIGHTRMATESAVTTMGAHPFSTGPDQCLVHNGSLSNHHNLRRDLIHDGMTFETENDTEVAAAYITWRMNQGMNLGEALQKSLDDLDGFFTFVVGTKNGFAVVRDPIACKPAVMAETDQYVAFGSEYRALAGLPGVDNARVWEPEPATVYFWER